MKNPTGKIEALLHIVASACAIAERPLTFAEIMSRVDMPTLQLAAALKSEWFKARWAAGGIGYEPSTAAKDYIIRAFYAQQASGFEMDVEETTVPIRRARRIDERVSADVLTPARMLKVWTP